VKEQCFYCCSKTHSHCKHHNPLTPTVTVRSSMMSIKTHTPMCETITSFEISSILSRLLKKCNICDFFCTELYKYGVMLYDIDKGCIRLNENICKKIKILKWSKKKESSFNFWTIDVSSHLWCLSPCQQKLVTIGNSNMLNINILNYRAGLNTLAKNRETWILSQGTWGRSEDMTGRLPTAS
jgi:hypothetical protein